MRESGFYWVRNSSINYDTEWRVARFFAESGTWFVAEAEEVGWFDDELDEIDERRIVREADQKDGPEPYNPLPPILLDVETGAHEIGEKDVTNALRAPRKGA